MNQKQKYLNSLLTVAIITAKENNPDGLTYAIEKNLKSFLKSEHNQFLTHLLKDKSESIYTPIMEYEKLLSLVPSTSSEIIKIANDKISEKYNELQQESLYDREIFTKIYFALNSTSQLDFEDNAFSRIFNNSINNKNENFNSWFANSKVVDDEKNPLTVYHGTGANEFTKFKFDNFPISYFAENKSYSDWFQKARGTQGAMFTCFLRVQNPIDLRLFGVNLVTYEEFVGYIELKYGYKLPLNRMLKALSDERGGLWAWRYLRAGVEWLKTIKEDGYFDGFKYYENNPDDLVDGVQNITPAWAVFNAEQIKSAKGNVTFSLDSKDIRFNKGGLTH